MQRFRLKQHISADALATFIYLINFIEPIVFEYTTQNSEKCVCEIEMPWFTDSGFLRGVREGHGSSGHIIAPLVFYEN